MQINIFFPISDRETKPQTEISPANVKPKVSMHNKGPTQSPSEALQAFPNILMGFDSWPRRPQSSFLYQSLNP